MSAVREAIVLQNRFRIDGKLNQGAFGVIYKGTDLQTNKRVAIKFESTFAPQPQLAYEFKLYTVLNSAQNLQTTVAASHNSNVGFPKVHWFGVEGTFYVLVMDLMGFSLEDLFQMCRKRFSLQTTLLLADQMLSLIETLHSHYYLYRDIKPDNFVIGLGEDQNKLHLLDFGLAKRYRDPSTMQHLPYHENCPVVGTVRYLSKSTHAGIEQSRRDDLESLGYTWVYFLKGQLPWQGLKVKNDKQRQEMIFQSKLKNTPEILCKDLPIEFQVYFKYINKLSFYDKPDYSMLRNLFRNLYKKMGYHEKNQKSLLSLLTNNAMNNGNPTPLVKPTVIPTNPEAASGGAKKTPDAPIVDKPLLLPPPHLNVVYDWHIILQQSRLFNPDAVVNPQDPMFIMSFKKSLKEQKRLQKAQQMAAAQQQQNNQNTTQP